MLSHGRGDGDVAGLPEAIEHDEQQPLLERPTETVHGPIKVGWSMVAAASAAALGSFLWGYDTGVIAGAMLYIEEEFELTERPAMKGFIVAVALMGAALAAFLAGALADLLGRRMVLLIAALLYVGSGALLWWSPVLAVLVVGRLVSGFGIGLASVVVSLYIAECAPADLRGRFNSIPQLLISCGILSAYCVGLGIAIIGEGNWRLMLGISAAPALLQIVFLPFVAESPRWLLSKGRMPEAHRSLAWLRRAPDQDLKAELASMSVVASDGLSWSVALKTFASEAEPRRLLLLGVAIQVLAQTTGINAVVYYTPSVLRDAGVEQLFKDLGLDADAASILATIVAYVPKIPTMLLALFFMDSWGRRRMLLLTIPLLIVSLVALSICSSFDSEDGLGRSISSLLSLTLFGCAFVAGFAPVPNIFCSELFPPPLRATGLSITLLAQWTANVAVSQTFPVMEARLGLPVTFGIFAIMCFLSLLFVARYFPETSRRPLEAGVDLRP